MIGERPAPAASTMGRKPSHSRPKRDRDPAISCVTSHVVYLGLVNNLVNCAIKGASGECHKYGLNRERIELQYIH
jgi:hypothetical protein